MKKLLLSVASFAVVAVTAMVAAPTTSEAVPGFARQTGAACLSCHFQAIPRLSAFGRAFSMSGMRDMGEAGLIEDDHLSLPAQFNASFLMKMKIANQTGLVGTGQDSGIQIPDESALFIAGRVSENMGTFIEINMNADEAGGVNAGGTGVAHVKLNYAMDVDNGLILLSMVSHGAGLGQAFSDPSNSVRHTNRSSQKRAAALENTMMMNSTVAGFGASIFLNDSFYIGGAAYAQAGTNLTTNPGWGSVDQINPYVRAAYIGEFGGLEAIVGGWWTNVKPGIASAVIANATSLSAIGAAKQYGVDLQLQGDVGDLSIGLYLPVVLKGEQVFDQTLAPPFANTAPTTDITGYQAMLTVAFGHAGIKLGYDYMKTKTIGTGASTNMKRPYLGAWYSIAQNVELDLAWTSTKVSGTPGNTTNTTLVVEYLY